eukprot:2032940-Ditylum_brightwellii.AAC.2
MPGGLTPIFAPVIQGRIDGKFSIGTLKCEVTAHVDNIMAVNTNNHKKCFPGIAAHTALDIDLLLKIWALQGEHLKVKAERLEAHQDTKCLDKPLSVPAKLNCMTDTDTLGYMQSGTNKCTIPPILSTSAATLKVNGMIVTSKVQDVLRDTSGCTGIQNYVQKKTGWVPEMMDWIRWQAIGSAFDS